MWSNCMEVVRTGSVREWGGEGRQGDFSLVMGRGVNKGNVRQRKDLKKGFYITTQ